MRIVTGDVLARITYEDFEKNFASCFEGRVAVVNTQVLDEWIGGFLQPGLILIGGVKSIGKSTFLHSIFCKPSFVETKGRLLFTPTHTAIDVGKLLVSSKADVPLQRLNSGRIVENDWPNVTCAASELAQGNLFLNTFNPISVNEICSLTKEVTSTETLEVILLDDIQQVLGFSIDTASGICRKLKALSVEVKTPIIATVSLPKQIKERHFPRPTMSDLIDNHSIANIADIVLFLHDTPDYYSAQFPGHKGVELIIAKDSSGKRSSTMMLLNSICPRFYYIQDRYTCDYDL